MIFQEFESKKDIVWDSAADSGGKKRFKKNTDLATDHDRSPGEPWRNISAERNRKRSAPRVPGTRFAEPSFAYVER